MPVTMNGYGQSYMPMGGPGVGAAIYGAQRQEVNFARMVELEKLNLRKRVLRQQAAAQAAQLQDRQQARAEEAALQQTKFDLEQRRLDMQDEENQRRRQDILDAFERTERDRRDKEAQAILDEKNRLTEVGATPWDGSGEQPSRYYTTRDGMVWDLSKVDMARLRGGSQQAGAPNMENVRKELNTLAEKGARPLAEGERPESGETLYIGPNNQMFAIPRKDASEEDMDHDPRVSKTNPKAFATKEARMRYTAKYGRDVLAASAEDVVAAEGEIDEEAERLGILLEDGSWALDDISKLKELADYEKKKMKQYNLESLEHNYGTLHEIASVLAELEGLTNYSDKDRVSDMINEANEDYNDELRGAETQSDRVFASRNRDEAIKRIREGEKRYAELSRKKDQYPPELVDRIRKSMPKTFGK
jgi:hypothetical protein